MARAARTAPKPSPLYARVRQILESARASAARSVNTTQVVANWLIGREIVEEEQKGTRKAGYGEQLLAELSVRLVREYGHGYSATNLRWFRQSFLCYPVLFPPSIHHALRDELAGTALIQAQDIHHATRDKISEAGRTPDTVPRKSATGALLGVEPIGHAVRGQSWAPGQLHPNLSWTHYRTLLRVDKPEARAFYEIESRNAVSRSRTFRHSG
jgi:hypothetical protein